MVMKKKVTIELTELDLKIMLEALGQHENSQHDRRLEAKATQIVIQKVYRAMGVNI